MKKINYFGKEYAVGDDVKWVATNSHGTVMAFTSEPVPVGMSWYGFTFYVLSRLPSGTIDWRNSLRKVEDIIAEENKLKVGDKVELLGNYCGFKKWQVVELYRLCTNGNHLFKGSNDLFSICDGEEGDHLCAHHYKVVTTTAEHKAHPHADLILKYAMIAQYDDKPWESFEFKNQYTPGWMTLVDHPCWDTENEYRLKPQEPKIQIGQVWKSEEGINVVVDTPSDMNTIYFKYHLGGLLIRKSVSLTHFTSHFKHKE